MKVLVDTNIILDVLAAREPFLPAAQQIFDLSAEGEIEGLLCATTFTSIQYLLRRRVGAIEALQHIRTLLSAFEVAPVDRAVLAAAANNGMKDFEDAVALEAARRVKAKMIVTRNVKDFVSAQIPVMGPTEFLATLRAKSTAL